MLRPSELSRTNAELYPVTSTRTNPYALHA